MSKRFDIRLGLEEADLEVDKVVDEQEEQKSEPDTKKVLDEVVEAAEKPEEAPVDETPTDAPAESTDAPVEVPEDNTTVDGTPVEAPAEEAPAEAPAEEAPAEEAPAETPVEEPAAEETPAEEPAEEAPAEEEKEVVPDLTQASDVTDAVKEKEKDDTQVDESLDAAASLESIALCLENSLDRGGISPTAARLTSIATNRIYNNVGLRITSQNKIAVESYNSPSARVRNTRLAIESIMDSINHLYEVIVAAISRSIQWIKDFIKTLTSEYDKRKADVKNLKDAASKVTKTTPNEGKDKYDNIVIINRLKAGTKVDVVDNIEELIKFSHGFHGYVETEKKLVLRNIKTMVDNARDGVSSLPEQVTLMGTLKGLGVIQREVAGHIPSLNTLESYAKVEVLPGDATFLALIPKDQMEDGQWNEAVRSSSFSFVTDQDQVTSVESLPVLTKDGISKLLDAVEKMCDEGLSSKKIYNEFITEKEHLQRDIKVLIKNHKPVSPSPLSKIGSLSDEEKPATKSVYAAGISARMQMVDKTFVAGSTKLDKLMLQTINASKEYINFSIRAYI
jgi:hypothetical protein